MEEKDFGQKLIAAMNEKTIQKNIIGRNIAQVGLEIKAKTFNDQCGEITLTNINNKEKFNIDIVDCDNINELIDFLEEVRDYLF